MFDDPLFIRRRIARDLLARDKDSHLDAKDLEAMEFEQEAIGYNRKLAIAKQTTSEADPRHEHGTSTLNFLETKTYWEVVVEMSVRYVSDAGLYSKLT